MLASAVILALLMFAAALALNIWRLFKGPDAVDRILALDTLYINAVALLVVYGLYIGDQRYYEAALLIALLGFISTMALCKYLLRGDIIE